ncbi:putative protein kinase [Trypanosoma grayi]|uniref:putative protein kinase n=1 Tax=Trypanosoma grayi TaxID=71804 RepID=UPI0004F47D43|nr:putative protein kinase [Trypanosoma grayi]KEG11939.1 putative protein kinase [Trypanosoma grayi]
MLGTVEKISHDGEYVRHVELRLPQRGSARGQLLSIRTCERIGQGSFGTVYRAMCEEYPRLALKIATGKSARLRQELEVLSKACTKGKLLLPRFEFGAINKAGDLIAVGMELCVPCTLHDLLLATRLTNEADMLFIAYQVLQAVACVHEQRCIHRDVKLQNFVFDLDGNLKLIDFGLASSVWNPPPGDVVAGTVSFMAPEMAHNALHRDQRVTVGAAADVWSAGIVLFSIFTQRNPYPAKTCSLTSPGSDDDDDDDDGGGAASNTLQKDNARLLRRVASGDWRWPVGCSISNNMRQLVEFILVRDPEKRPDILAILSKPIWNLRRRSPPAAVTAFLGVQDDFLLSHDEAQLLRAVEQRSADITASLMGSRANSPDADADDTDQRSSLKFVAKKETAVGGLPTHQVYDFRPEAKQKKPIREISVVLAEETAKMCRRGGLRQSKDGAASVVRGNSRTRSRANSCANSRATSLATVHRSDENEDDEKVKREGVADRGGNPTSETHGKDEDSKETVEVEEKRREMFSSEWALVQDGHTRDAKTVGQSTTPMKNETNRNDEPPKEVPAPCTKGGTAVRKGSRAPRGKGGAKRAAEDMAPASLDAVPSKRPRAENDKSALIDKEFVVLIARETAVRASEEEELLLRHKCLLGGFRIAIEESQERFSMIWLAEEQRRSAAHPHRFKETTRISKKYQYGFVCDLCDFEFLPDGKNIHFFHCSCGRDLCLDCHETYSKQCTCATCGNVYENSVALRDHCLKGACKVVGAPAAATSASRGRTSTQIHPQSLSSNVTSTKSATRAGTARRGKASTLGTTTSVVEAAKGAVVNEKKVKAEHVVQNEGASGTSPSSSSLFSRPINTLPQGQWKPMERLSVSYRPVQPTAEEREALLHGDWIRHFHLFPVEEEDVEPVAFTYHIQPGRTGAIFLNHSFSMHSAVISVLERQMLIVDYVDTYENRDAARAVSLVQAKCSVENAFNLLQRVVAYDCNMLKQHRAPGTISVYRNTQTAVRCQGDPFVYVRWFRFDSERSLSAFLLSNGAVQVFVSDQYEIRWFDESRKFILRSNGVCEIVDDATFALAPDVSRLLYDEF